MLQKKGHSNEVQFDKIQVENGTLFKLEHDMQILSHNASH